MQTPLNTFRICQPQGTEKFTYHMPYISVPVYEKGYNNNIFSRVVKKGYYILPGVKDIMKDIIEDAAGMPEQLAFRNITVNYIVDLYVDWTDYTLYKTKQLTFHHLN